MQNRRPEVRDVVRRREEYRYRRGAIDIVCKVYHYWMNRIRPLFVDPDPANRTAVGDILVREEPDQEEEDEEEEEQEEDDDEDDNGGSDGYSE